MLSTHPKVGMAVLIGARVKAKVRALARRDAHSFLVVRAVCCIAALRHAVATSFFTSSRRAVSDRLRSGFSLFLGLVFVLFRSGFCLVFVLV